MSWGELTFASLMAEAGIGFMTLSHQAEGTAGLIRSAIGSIQAAREQYDAEKGGHAFTLRIEGKDNRGYQPVDGEYPVVGEHGEAGFILEAGGGRYVSACKSTACDWHADKAVLVTGAAQVTTITHHQGAAVTVAGLREALELAQGAGKVHLVGSARSEAIKPAPPVLEAAGGKVVLHFYPAEGLADWPITTLRDVDLSIQVRHAPEVTPPEVVIPEDGGERIDPLLGRWLNP